MLQSRGKFFIPTVASSVATLFAICTLRSNGDVSPSTLPAQPTTAPVVSNADVLIRQLGDDDADTRDSAQKQLVDMRQAVVPALKKAADENDDPEIRTRAAAALAQIKDAEYNGTSLITLHLKDAPEQDVLDAIGKQSQATFGGFGGFRGRPIATVSLDAEHKPFWDVMTDVCTQLNVCPQIDGAGKNSVQLIPNNRNFMTGSPHEIVGPFWVGVTSLFRERSIDLLGAPLVEDQFSIRLMVLPEPKLSVIQMSGLVLKEVADDAGNSLLPRNKMALANHIMRNPRQMNHTVESRLYYPEHPGKNIAILRGEVTVMLAEDIQQYQVNDVLGTPKITNPLTDRKIQATVTRQTADSFRVIVQCTREGLGDQQWQAMIDHANDVTLEDAQGRAYTANQTTISMTSTEGETLLINSVFNRPVFGAMPANPPQNKVGDPTRLIWSVATRVKPVVVPVTFKNLPMP